MNECSFNDIFFDLLFAIQLSWNTWKSSKSKQAQKLFQCIFFFAFEVDSPSISTRTIFFLSSIPARCTVQFSIKVRVSCTSNRLFFFCFFDYISFHIVLLMYVVWSKWKHVNFTKSVKGVTSFFKLTYKTIVAILITN